MKRYTGTIPAVIRVEFYADNEADARAKLSEIAVKTGLATAHDDVLLAELLKNETQREVIESDYLNTN